MRRSLGLRAHRVGVETLRFGPAAPEHRAERPLRGFLSGPLPLAFVGSVEEDLDDPERGARALKEQAQVLAGAPAQGNDEKCLTRRPGSAVHPLQAVPRRAFGHDLPI